MNIIHTVFSIFEENIADYFRNMFSLDIINQEFIKISSITEQGSNTLLLPEDYKCYILSIGTYPDFSYCLAPYRTGRFSHINSRLFFKKQHGNRLPPILM
ncbi:MAG: hypothetical protein JXB88_04995 [Spirochaetales bacterium]|nr:hypothetical protein [Spirochaetales bacterium]